MSDHRETRVTLEPLGLIHDDQERELVLAGYVAWCACSVGSPARVSVAQARDALAVHLADPARLPR